MSRFYSAYTAQNKGERGMKNRFTSIILILLTFVLFGCDEGLIENTLTSLSVTPSSANIDIGSTQQFTAVGTFADGFTADITSLVTWNSSDTAAATLSSSGLATGLAVGVSNVTATLNSVTSNSVPLAVGVPSSIAITPSTATIGLSVSQQFTATGTYANGSTADLTSVVTWNSSNTAVVTISAAGVASTLAVGTSTITSTLEFITSNEASLEVKQIYAYVANEGNNTVSICPVNSDASLGACSASNGGGTFSQPLGVSLSANGFAYVANLSGNSDGNVSICSVNSNDGSLESCTTSNGGTDPTLSFLYPTATALNAANTFLYASNFGNDTFGIAICPMNNDGSLGPCTSSDGSGTVSLAQGIIVNGDFLYVANVAHVRGLDDPSNISICPLNNDGSVGTCTISYGSGTFVVPFGLALNPEGSILYVSNFGNGSTIPFSVTDCPLNSDGTLGTCTTNVSDTFDFSANTEAALFIGSNHYAYVPNCGSNSISICPVNEDGSFGTCPAASSDPTFNNPSGVTLSLVQ